MRIDTYSGDLDSFDYLSLLVIDQQGALRSVSLPRSYVSEKTFRDGIGFDASNFAFAQVRSSDMTAVPDLASAFEEERGGYRVLHAFCDVRSTDGEPFLQYPRVVAKKAESYLNSSGLGEMAQMLVELEFYVFEDVRYYTTADRSYYFVESAEGLGEEYEDKDRFGLSRGYHRMAPDDKYVLLRDRAVESMLGAGIPVKYHHHEAGASQMEIELDFLPLARAADAVVLAKWILKATAEELGLKITFMPKPMYKIAGSGMHVHQYITKGGASLFPGDGACGLSGTGLSYTAGILSHALTGSLLAFSNPSTNSYRRLVPGFEAPVNATFAQGSRAAAVRIPGYLKKGEARVEFRTGDATANTHYFLAAMLLAGLDGVKRAMDPVKLGFSSAKPGPRTTLPTGLYHVLAGLKKDKDYLAPAFPDELISSWVDAKIKEAEYVYNAPVPQEYELYF